jgi:transcriptional regulator with PAS, ATPase and Fis domain/ligand-binding sensor domain-containing protein
LSLLCTPIATGPFAAPAAAQAARTIASTAPRVQPRETPVAPDDGELGWGHRVWTTEQGLPQNIIRALTQTRDGYLWIGTGTGLARFDGVSMTVFEVTTTPAFTTNWITALYEGSDGTLWIGTAEGVVRYRDGQFSHETLPDGVDAEQVRGICGDRDGHVWIVSRGQVLRHDGARWAPVLTGQMLSAVLVDRRGSMWFATEEGAIEWRDGKVRRTLSVRDGLPPGLVRALQEDGDGRVWIGTTGGLALFDPESGRLTRPPAPLADVAVTDLFEDRDGQLWIGSYSKVLVRTAAGRLVSYPISTAGEDAQVGSLMQDREGHVWLGAEGGPGGLHRFSRRRVTVLAHEDGLPCDNVVPVTQTTDGAVWLSTLCSDGRGLTVIRDGKVQEIPASAGPIPSFISSMLPAPDGGLWIGGYDGSLVRFKDGRFTKVEGTGLSGAALQVLHLDPQGRLWAGTNQGLSRYDGKSWVRFSTAEGLVHNDVRAIVDDGSGGIWIGTNAGLSRYAGGQFTTYNEAIGLQTGAVRALHVDTDGVLWIGTYGGGLSRLRSGMITRYGTQGGLLDGTIHRILEDDRGVLWMSGNRGIRRVSRRELSDVADGRPSRAAVKLYDESDGMKNAECNGMGQPAGWKMRDGSLWFPTQGGVVRLDPADDGREDDVAPPVVIEAINVNGVAQRLAAAITSLSGATELEVRYTAPAFERSEQIQFRYRLTGHDDEWVDAGTRRVAYFANLAPGDYRFQVIARGSAGTWNETGASFIVALTPYFYQRTGFRIILAGLLLAAALGGYRLRVARLSQRAQALEAMVSARTGELRVEREGLTQAYEALNEAKEELEGSHAQLTAVFDQLRVGVIIVNNRFEVMFVSQATSRLIAGAGERMVGRPLEQLLPVSIEAMAEIRRHLMAPGAGARLAAELQPESGQRYWAEIEVRADPRDERNRILYLYDVTETYDLKRAHESAPRGASAGLLGSSSAIRLVQGQIDVVAGVDATVLIEGETGTGKELVARAIHQASRRRDRPFVAINCAGLTESLLASQLFGHRRGAFTGAVSDHVGLFEAAQGGTLLLDEIGDMPMSVQTHLLRVLQEREILRVGDSKPRPIDVRVLAATHRSLEMEVDEGRFREDLLYRIRVVRILLPPLRLRREDIPLLATAFMQELSAAHGTKLSGISRDVMERLLSHRWPGNVRELKSVIEGAVIRATGPLLKLSDLPLEPADDLVPPARGPMPEAERRLLIETLRRTGGNRSVAARLLGVSRATLYRRLAALEALEPEALADDLEDSSEDSPID